MRNWLNGQYIVLTGASSGIGRELCKIFIQKYGAKVIGIGRREEKMLSLKSELGNEGEKFSYSLFDVREENAWERFAEELKNKGIFPKMLVNNAGIFPRFDKARNLTSATAEEVIKTNYLATVYAVNAVLPLLKGTEKEKPAIVNIASSAALCSVCGTSAYSASKGAVKGYTEVLQMEEKGKICVCAVYPGTTATELFHQDENTENSALNTVAMSAEKMAKKISKRILRKKRRSVVGWDAKCMSVIARIAPVKGLYLIRWVMRISGSKVFSRVFDGKERKNKK